MAVFLYLIPDGLRHATDKVLLVDPLVADEDKVGDELDIQVPFHHISSGEG